MEYSETLKPLIESLTSLRRDAINTGRDIIGENLCLEDLYYISSIDKCIRVIDGFIPLIQQRNLSCAGALLRIQLDNCMRLFAVYIAKDKDGLIRNYISAKEKLSKMVDKNGKKMTDAYLKEQITVYEKHFTNVYNNTSGYIHFSEKSFFAITRAMEDNIISFNIGCELDEECNPFLIECFEAYIHYLKFYLSLFKPITDSKRRLDEKLEQVDTAHEA